MRKIYNDFDLLEFAKSQPVKNVDSIEIFDIPIEEQLIEYAGNLVENKIGNKNDIQRGDIVIVKKFTDKNSKKVNNREHQLYVIGNTGENNAKKRVYYGYCLSTNINISNKYNKKFQHRIFISDADSMYLGNTPNHKQLYIDLEGPDTFTLDDLHGKYWWIGKTTPEFQKFISDVAKTLQKSFGNNLYRTVKNGEFRRTVAPNI